MNLEDIPAIRAAFLTLVRNYRHDHEELLKRREMAERQQRKSAIMRINGDINRICINYEEGMADLSEAFFGDPDIEEPIEVLAWVEHFLACDGIGPKLAKRIRENIEVVD